jgi:hypothetical protein
MNTKFSTLYRALAAIILLLSTGGTALSDEMSWAGVAVLRGTVSNVRQPEQPQQTVVAPPPVPSCPEGYFYSLLGGYCYRWHDPLNR